MSTSLSPSRRQLLLGGLAATTGLLAACGSSGSSGGSSSSSGTSALSYQLGWLPTTEWAPTWVALDKGYYTKEGLKLSWLPGGPSVTSDTVVAAGRADVGSSNADSIAKARNQGAPLKIFGASFLKNPFCILSLAESPISSPQEMKGKKIGVAAGNQTAFELLLSLNDMSTKDLTVVPVQFDPSPVANREVDGQVVFSVNEPTQLEAKGISTHVFLFADFGYDIFADVFFATEQTISDRADDLVGFLRATRKGWVDNIADPQLATDLAVKKYGKDQKLDAAQQLLESKALSSLVVISSGQKPIQLPDDLVTANIKTLAAAGIKATDSDLFTTKILQRL